MLTELQAPPVRIGVLGCASIATRRMLAAVERAAGATLTAVASRTADRAKAVAARFGTRSVVGYRNLLAMPDVDAVYIPLPNQLHAEWIEIALRAGKHVLAEKPLTTSRARTAELVVLAETERLVLAENVVFPHHAQHAHVRAHLEQGVVGQVRQVSASFTIPPREPSDIRYQRALGGGALLDLGVYPVSAVQLLLGHGLTVSGASLRFEGGVDRSGGALLSRPDGVTAHLSFGMEHSYLSRYEVHGSSGRIVVDQAYTPDAASAPLVTVERGGKVERLVLRPDDQYANAISEFSRSIRGATRTVDPAIVDRARLLDAIRARAACRAA